MPHHANGTLLKYNALWKAGMHYDYKFFRVTKTTPKGNFMGNYVRSTRTLLHFDHDTSSERWQIGAPMDRICRLPHPTHWRPVTEEEESQGIVATSCVY